MNQTGLVNRAILSVVLALTMPLVSQAARPVARWDVVPDQIFQGVFKAGVCAFHSSGVKVEFRIGDKLIYTALEPTLNDQSGVWEFWCPVDAQSFPDGAVTLTARAIPLGAGHSSYDLPALTLYANAGGTLSVKQVTWVDAQNGNDANAGTEQAPCQTLAKAVRMTPAGGTIYLKPGIYSAAALKGGSNRPYWTTIACAPGVGRDQVEIGAGRPGTQRLRFKDVTLFCDIQKGYGAILAGENGKHWVWLENCKCYNKKGRWAGSTVTFGNGYGAFITGGVTTEMRNGPGGSLIRDHVLHKICSDAWTGCGLVVNSSCIDLDRGRTEAHPDFHQSHAVPPNWVENVILYNVRGYDCVSQGLFGLRLRNSAFVNVVIEKVNTVMRSQYSGPMENVLFLHLNIVDQVWNWRGDFTPTDVQVINGIFSSMGLHQLTGSTNGLTLHHNHFVNAKQPMGSDVTMGPPLYLDPSNNDYSIQSNSPAWGTGYYLQCVPADIDGTPYPGNGRNRGCYAKPDARKL